VKILYDVGGATARYTKALALKNHPEDTIIFEDGITGREAIDTHVVQRLDMAAIPNLNMQDMQPWAINSDSAYWAAYSALAYVLAYSPSFYGSNPPTSWKALWAADVQGKIAVPAIGHSETIPFLQMISTIYGGSNKNPNPGLKALALLKPKAQTFFYTDWIADYTSGDVVLATEFDYYINYLKSTGVKIDMAIPKEGALAESENVAVIGGISPTLRQMANAYINLLMSKSIQTEVGTELLSAPSRKDVSLPAKIASTLVCYGPTLPKCVFPANYTYDVSVLPKWTELLEEQVGVAWGKA
jgi:putative spermidine/putrescine transport system substrate-binding protein